MHAQLEAHAAADSRVPAPRRWARGAIAAEGRSRCSGRRGPASRTACRGRRCSRCTRASKGSSRRPGNDASLTQLWGPRYNTYVVAKRDFALFSLGRLPDNEKGRRRAEETADRERDLDGRRMTDREVAGALGIGNAIRYAATTGTVAIRGRRPRAGRLDRGGRRHRPGRRLPRARSALPPRLRAGDRPRGSRAGPESPGARVLPHSPRSRESLGGRSIAARRRVAAGGGRARDARQGASDASARLLPSGDAYFLLDRAERGGSSLSAEDRGRLWTSRSGQERSWSTARSAAPGGRPGIVRVGAWRTALGRSADAVEGRRPPSLPGLGREIEVVWET